MYMKKIHTYLLLSLTLIFSFFSCEIEEPIDPNQPSADGVLKNASIGQLNELVTGILASTSTELGTYYDVVGVIGRDIYRFDTADPRFVGDLLGTGNLDNSAFYTNNSYAQRYASVKTANILIEACQNTSTLTPEQVQGYLGFAKTLKAFELLNAHNHQYDNGIRIDVADPFNLGPFTGSAAESLTQIAAILAEAATHNAAAGNSFAFELTSGFETTDETQSFTIPSNFAKFIKALQARVEIYRGNFGEALTFVDQSFLDETGNFSLGVYRVFANASGDRVNPLFYPQNTNGTTRLAHPTWLSDAIPGDLRLAKATTRTEVAESADLIATHDAFRYTTDTSPIAIIRNEELILIKAEALIQTNQFATAKDLLDLIREDVGNIGEYAGPLTLDALIDEVLFQRRYSLWDEGHRWIDMRRYDRLDELTIDRVDDSVIREMPRPFNELGVQGG
jgi:starch-binding outer membrane protein, SusD/RagB family